MDSFYLLEAEKGTVSEAERGARPLGHGTYLRKSVQQTLAGTVHGGTTGCRRELFPETPTVPRRVDPVH